MKTSFKRFLIRSAYIASIFLLFLLTIQNPKIDLTNDSTPRVPSENPSKLIPNSAAIGDLLFGWGTYGTGDGQFHDPSGIAINSTGQVYVMDRNNDRVQIFHQNGTFISKWGEFGLNDGQFQSPMAILINASDYLYVLDSWNCRVQVFYPNNTFLFSFGAWGSADGQLKYPYGFALNASGHIYVADSYNNRVEVFSPTGQYLYQWSISNPRGIAINSSGQVYVTEYDNNCTTVFTQTGQTLFQFGSTGSGNGEFKNPQGTWFDQFGHLYIADFNNYRFQIFYPNGTFRMIFGSGLVYPSGLTVNAQGHVYVTAFDWLINVYSFAMEIPSTGLTPNKLCNAVPPAFSLNVVSFDPLDEVWYSLDGGATNTSCNLADTLADQWPGIGNGTVTVTFWANNTVGLCVKAEIKLLKDILAPNITDTGLISGYLYGVSPPTFSLSIVEANRDKIWYSLNGGVTNTTCGLTGTLNAQWGAHFNGSITITFWANDTIGNENSTSITIEKDATVPWITNTGLIPGQVCNASAPIFSLTVVDDNAIVAWYSLNGGLSNTTCNYEDTLSGQWDLHGNGTITVYFWVEDIAGNINSTSVMLFKDVAPPSFTSTGLSSGNIYGINPPSFSLVIAEAHLAETWYSLDNGVTNTSCGLTGSLSAQWSGVGNGTTAVTFWANDTVGNLGSINILIQKDIVAPIFGSTGLSEYQVFGIAAPAFNLVMIESNLHRLWYSLNGGLTNTSCIPSGTLSTQWDSLGNGTVIVSFWANDTLGNINRFEVQLGKDIIAPKITFLTPSQGTRYSSVPQISLNIEEGNLDEQWYTIGLSSVRHYFSGTSVTIDSMEWAKLQVGDVIIYFYASDIVGNVGSTQILIKKENPPLDPITIFAILLSCVFVPIIVIMIRRRIHKKKYII